MELGEQIDKLHIQESGQIWELQDTDVVLHTKGKKFKRRYVIVLSKMTTEHDPEVINIIPLSTSVKNPDRFTPNVFKHLEETHTGFTAKKNSVALLQFYQPILKKHFNQKCAKISEECYNELKNLLCIEIIGFDLDEFDLTP